MHFKRLLGCFHLSVFDKGILFAIIGTGRRDVKPDKFTVVFEVRREVSRFRFPREVGDVEGISGHSRASWRW